MSMAILRWILGGSGGSLMLSGYICLLFQNGNRLDGVYDS